jgi:hypothetical protein
LKAQATKAKVKKWNYIKLKSSAQQNVKASQVQWLMPAISAP